MLQFRGQFFGCIRLIFLLFDQLQRQAATRDVASRVKVYPSSFEKFMDLMNEPDFEQQLKEASKNPNSSSITE